MRTSHGAVATFVVLTAAIASAPIPSRGDDTIKMPGDHPKYSVEIEPHLLWGWADYDFAPGNGIGIGGRFSIPIVDNGFVPTINNSVAISFGVDWVHYQGSCYYYNLNRVCYGVDADYLFFPVTMQWNFFVARQWSVFAEPGLAIWHGWSNYCGNPVFAGVPCNNYSNTELAPVFYAGGRFHFNDHVALVMRIGYPTFSFGVSFM